MLVASIYNLAVKRKLAESLLRSRMPRTLPGVRVRLACIGSGVTWAMRSALCAGLTADAVGMQ